MNYLSNTPQTTAATVSNQATSSNQGEHFSARTRVHDVFDPHDRSAEEMSWVLGRHVEPTFAVQAG